MSRLAIAFTFIASLTTPALADQPSPHFAQAPVASARAEMMPLVVDRDTVRAALVAARKANLQRFRDYQAAGVFPSNTFQGKKLNVWRDEDGHFCAAATIIRLSGLTDLADRVAEQSNFIRLADVKQGPLMDWILTSGLTQDEIAAIQEPFMPVVEKPSPAPQPIDLAMRKAENARLRAKYRQVEKMIVRNASKSLDLAVARLMKRPELAANLVGGMFGGRERLDGGPS
jgi:hypothetical protein